MEHIMCSLKSWLYQYLHPFRNSFYWLLYSWVGHIFCFFVWLMVFCWKLDMLGLVHTIDSAVVDIFARLFYFIFFNPLDFLGLLLSPRTPLVSQCLISVCAWILRPHRFLPYADWCVQLGTICKVQIAFKSFGICLKPWPLGAPLPVCLVC